MSARHARSKRRGPAARYPASSRSPLARPRAPSRIRSLRRRRRRSSAVTRSISRRWTRPFDRAPTSSGLRRTAPGSRGPRSRRTVVTTGIWLVVQSEVDQRVRDIIEESAKAAPGGPLQRSGDYYNSYLDEAAIEKLGKETARALARSHRQSRRQERARERDRARAPRRRRPDEQQRLPHEPRPRTLDRSRSQRAREERGVPASRRARDGRSIVLPRRVEGRGPGQVREARRRDVQARGRRRRRRESREGRGAREEDRRRARDAHRVGGRHEGE